jgi:hypothetical protein
MSRIVAVFVPAVWLCLVSLPAAAEDTQQQSAAAEPGVSEIDGASYKVEFDDDLLDGVGLDGTIPLIRVRIGAARSPLLRPRTSFVRELKKSVELL